MDKIYSAYQHQSINFKPEKLGTYHLRLLMRKGLLQYAVVSENQKILAAKEYRSKKEMDFGDFFDAIFQQDYFLKEEYASVRVINGNLEFSLIPTAHFQARQIKEFAGALVKDNFDIDHLQYLNMDVGGATAVFSVPFSLKQKCDYYLNKPEYVPFCLQAINMSHWFAEKNANLLLVNIFEGEFVLTAMIDRKLSICNSYQYESGTDIVYFVQVLLEILKINPAETKMMFTGEFEADSELIRQLKKLIPTMIIPANQLQDTFETRSEKLPTWRYAYLTF